MPWRSAFGLGGHAAAVDAGHHVHARVVAGRLERLARHALQADAREVLVEVATVDRVGRPRPASGSRERRRSCACRWRCSGHRPRARAACRPPARARRPPRPARRPRPGSVGIGVLAVLVVLAALERCSSSTRSGSRWAPGMTSSPPASFSLRARGSVGELSRRAASSARCLLGRLGGLVELVRALDLGAGGVRICRLLLGGASGAAASARSRRRGLARLARSALGVSSSEGRSSPSGCCGSSVIRRLPPSARASARRADGRARRRP